MFPNFCQDTSFNCSRWIWVYHPRSSARVLLHCFWLLIGVTWSSCWLFAFPISPWRLLSWRRNCTSLRNSSRRWPSRGRRNWGRRRRSPLYAHRNILPQHTHFFFFLLNAVKSCYRLRLQERQKQLESMGISLESSGIKVGEDKCFLVNLNADPALNELLVYYLKVWFDNGTMV